MGHAVMLIVLLLAMVLVVLVTCMSWSLGLRPQLGCLGQPSMLGQQSAATAHLDVLWKGHGALVRLLSTGNVPEA